MKQQNSLRIGLVISNIEDDFPAAVTSGAIEAAGELGDSLFIFPAKYLAHNSTTSKKYGVKYEYQYNVIAEYARSSSLDAVIILLSSIGYNATEAERMKLLHSYGDIPVILVASEAEGCTNVNFDNRTGLRDAINHLIRHSGCKRIAFLTVGGDTVDKLQREQVYRRTLEENSIEIDEKLIRRGSDYEYCSSEADSLLGLASPPDAIVCSDDVIAKFIYPHIKTLGIRIGTDLRIVGFDDIADAVQLVPPLATVRADPAQLGRLAVREAHVRLTDKDYENHEILVPTEYINRQSADTMATADIVNSHESELTCQEMRRANKFINSFSRVLLHMNGFEKDTIRHFLEATSSDFFTSCYFYLLPNFIRHRPRSKWICPEYMKLCGYRSGQSTHMLRGKRSDIPFEQLFDNRYLPDTPDTYIVIDIYADDKQYGILVCNITPSYYHYCEAICYQSGIMMKLLEILHTQRDLLQKLGTENARLDIESTVDELTGVFNRRGFVDAVQTELVSPANADKTACMFFCDTDYLKKINDNFGHSEGDYAIRNSAKAIRSTLGRNAIIGRLGGDEFAALLISPTATQQEYVRDIKLKMTNIGQMSGKKYPLGLSVGAYSFRITSTTSLDGVLGKADESLYRNKKLKPPFIL